MHDDDLRDSDAGSDSLPLPGWVATGRGYTREVALESVGAGWAALIHFLFDRIERRRFVFSLSLRKTGKRLHALFKPGRWPRDVQSLPAPSCII